MSFGFETTAEEAAAHFAPRIAGKNGTATRRESLPSRLNLIFPGSSPDNRNLAKLARCRMRAGAREEWLWAVGFGWADFEEVRAWGQGRDVKNEKLTQVRK